MQTQPSETELDRMNSDVNSGSDSSSASGSGDGSLSDDEAQPTPEAASPSDTQPQELIESTPHIAHAHTLPEQPLEPLSPPPLPTPLLAQPTRPSPATEEKRRWMLPESSDDPFLLWFNQSQSVSFNAHLLLQKYSNC